MPRVHAIEFLNDPDKPQLAPVIVVYGAEAFLRAEVLHALCRRLAGAGDDAPACVARFSGDETEWKSVADELRTVSMWGDARVAVVDDADPFVTNCRSSLERYVASPAKGSTLILLVKSWPRNTRLAKAVAKTGLAVECSQLKGPALLKWIAETARREHGKKLARPAAALMVELAGEAAGVLSQELAKLAAYVGDADRISQDDVRAIVGDWATQTAFAMVEALLAGRLDRALKLLDELLAAGEAPPKVLGAVSHSFRKLTAAAEHARHGTRLKDALAKSGVFRNRIHEANDYLRRIGRPRAERILPAILATDVNLKGGSRISGRLELERLMVRLSGRLPVEMS